NRKGVNIINSAGSSVGNTPITLRLTNVPLGEALRYTSNLAQLKFKVESHAVVIVPLSTPDADLFTNRYKVPPTFLQAQPNAGGGAAADPFAPAQQGGTVARRMTVKQRLEEAGITFGSGATAIYNPVSGDLIVKNTPDQMDLVEAYIESINTGPTQPTSPGSVYKLPDEIEDMEVDNSASIELEEKLKTIRIPSLEFTDTPLKDALQFIEQKAGEMDFAESDFSKKGISIAISDDIPTGAASAPPGAIGNNFGFEGGRQSSPIGNTGDAAYTPINLRLTNVPLGEALRYTTNLANLKYRIENGRIVVVPLSAPETKLVSSTYILAPELQQKLLAPPQNFPAGDPFSSEPLPAPSKPTTVKEIMENVGITFPPGADVSLDPASGSLRVTNSPDQAELVEAWLSSLDEGRPIIELQSKNVDRFPESESNAFIGNDALQGTPIGSGNGLKKVGELFSSTAETIEGNRDSLDAVVIEQVDFNGQTVEEALQLLEAKIKEIPAGESHAAALRIELDDIGEDTKKKKLDFSIAKATAIEILDKIVGESETRYYVTKSGVVIADQNTEILPMETVFLPMPARVFQSLNEDGSIHDHHARNILKAAGIDFPRGSSAAYNTSTGRLAVRNTKQNIEAVLNQFANEIKAVEDHPNAPENNLRFSSAFLGGASKLKGFQASDVGRLPVVFDLPGAGRVYRFQGLYAPDSLDFRYVTWDRQIRSAWGWIIVGLTGFLLGAWKFAKMPLFLGIFIAIFLTFLPFVFGQGLGPFCNSLLLGWFAGLATWLLYVAVKRITPTAHWCIWLIPAILISQNATAAPPEESVESHTVYVPYDPEKPVQEQDATRFYLDYDTFATLWKQVKEFRKTKSTKPENTKPGYTISSSLYRINSTPARLSVSGRISLSTRGKDWQQIPLPFSGANISEITLNGKAASFHNGSIVIEKSGHHIVEVKYEIPVGKRQEKLTWSIPKSSSVLLEIEMDNDLAEPVVQENWPLAKTNPNGGSTIYTAAIGQQDKITFRRRLKTSGRSMTRPNAAVINAKLFVAQGIEQLEATYQLNFSGQEDNRFTIAFENTVTPVRFDIPNLSLWEIRNKPGTNLRELTFFLTQPVSDSLSVKFTGERLVDSPSRTFPELSAEAGRIEQNRHLYRAGGISIVPKPTANHRQISGSPDSSGFIQTASYSLAGSNEDLAYQASAMRAKRSAKASYVFQLGASKLETIAQFQIQSPEEPLLDSRFTIPQNAKIQKIDGNRIKDWWRTGDEIFIRFEGGTPEVTAVLLYITQPVDDSEENFSLPLTSFPIAGFENEEVEGEGLIVAHTTRDISIDFAEERRVIREIGINEVAKDFEILPPMEKKRGFRFENMNFSATVNSEQLEPGFHSLWVMFGRVHDGWVQLSVHTDIEVSRSGLDRISFQTAADVPEFRIPDDDIREVRISEENGVRRYEVIFQQYVTDAISFTMETEIPHNGGTSLPDITITDSAREEKFLIVENLSAQQMELRPENLATTVMATLPYKPETLASAQLFRAGANWSLDIEMENLETTAGNQAVIVYAELTSAFRRNGEEWLKAVYHIQNRSLQFLPVAKPKGAELVSVVVAESEVRADRGTVEGNDVILVPLIQTKPGQLAYDVTLVFRSPGDSKLIGKRFRKRLDDPAVYGPTIEKTMWKVHLPTDHELVDFKGNMQPIREEESKLRKLQSDLAELKGLNYYSSRAVNDSRSRQESNGNAQILAERIEQTLGEVQQQDEQVEKIEKELDAQKVIITENRIQMPVFEPGSQVDKPSDQIGWLSNSGTIKSRNRDYSNIVQKQTKRLESQVRLNDNISIGNQFFNNIESPQKKKQQKPVPGNEKYSQIGHLQITPQSGMVERKLSRLNNTQNIEQADVLKRKVSKKEKAKAESERQTYSNARSTFRQIGHGGFTPPSGQQAEPNAEPDPFGGSAAAKDGIQQDSVEYSTGYSQRPNRVQSADSEFGNTFQSQGGNSIRV
ncbi:MAG: hypothetical protein P1V20_31770, partial [Verrucomicrobiales bacterium]|nr:hypothetical protein [Verrucomicrobiales bacterium]